ncbi:glutathione peroxidase [Neisseria shayeganii]|uniref:Antioxidant n=2 Tax=Neisseria shayeganii TaxID=607712 RepID=G4CHK2_9NEIS|nr:glutathione peroxidase [Neisseria shayeganii]EGY52667.1 antioxidant [Neisseria shayeganii 871]QMT40914.1 glutathione peroxidase [Neisseria shayeganii]
MSVNIKTRDELVGQNVPDVVFHTRQGDAWKDVSTADLFKGKTVAVFSLPGAFTPTCSSTHLPRYNELAKEFYARGVDTIACISVNDTFVMNAWLADQEAENIVVVPDGNGEFTKGMGMLVSKDQLGFGDRSWRYSMLVKDGKIEEVFIEPVKEGDPFEVSDADTMLKHIDPNWKAQESVAIFTKPGCQYCAKAKELLAEKGLAYEEIVLGKDASTTSVRAITGKTSAPQVFIGGKYIGGSEELEKYFA